ncbi:protein of unknown function [Methanocaldococcus lauensis]|uniref:ATPase domain-containing protein n=1 Tax=Methanocaldococcus lauensis TaxID=2546128 RepID=A0A8D6PTX6_9EURY|nr:protein of unknown function [Methanocaldococcus lauensis]
MKFFNREKEIKEILSILEDEPNNIYFIFGPINSGKTALMKYIIENKIDKNKNITYINLREHFISKYEDFEAKLRATKTESFRLIVEILFEEHSDDKESLITNLIKDISLISSIPIPKNILDELLNKKRSKNVFKYIY